MKISTRLSAGFGLLILLFILCTGIAVHALRQATEGMNDTVDVKMKRFALVVDTGEKFTI
ncbi:chemotaxis protein [Pantoea sp. S62]|nr:chemotaxis protein [Pantoea sp. S62]